MWFMLIVLVLLSFGAVMSYSASAVYAERYYDSSTYFLWRYILFALISIISSYVYKVFFSLPAGVRVLRRGNAVYAVAVYVR